MCVRKFQIHFLSKAAVIGSLRQTHAFSAFNLQNDFMKDQQKNTKEQNNASEILNYLPFLLVLLCISC